MKILDWFLPARWEGRVEARTRGRLTVGAAWGLALAVFVGLPLLAAAAMSLSSVSVIANSLRLRSADV